MGWLRSNWLDALIFLLVAIIMAGVVFFLTGVNPLSAFSGSSNTGVVSAPLPNPTSAPQPTQAAQVQTTTEKPSATAQPSASSQTTAKPTAPTTPKPAAPTTNKPASTPSTTASNPKPAAPTQSSTQNSVESANESTEEVVVIPLPQSPQADGNAAPRPVPAPARIEPRAPVVTPQAVETPAPKPQAQPKPVQVRRSADPGGSWRIAVGSFSQTANAERLASNLRSRGYPVSLEASGSNTRVWVGPYDSSSRARAVAGTLGAYSPQVSRGGSAPSTMASSAPASTPAAQTPVAATPEPAVSSGFLQAGAFRLQERAQAVADQVQAAGFSATVVDAGNVYRVRVGPVSDTAAAIRTLRARGIEAVAAR